jgi:hypothetical protein
MRQLTIRLVKWILRHTLPKSVVVVCVLGDGIERVDEARRASV